MMKKTLILVTLLFVLQPFSSQAGMTLLGGLNYANPKYTDPTIALTSKAKSALSFGLLFDKSFTPLFAVESGVLYNKESFSLTATGVDATIKTTRLHFPLMLRLKALSFLSVGAGVYYENGLGNIEYAYTLPTVISGTNSYSDSGFKKEDYGLDFDLRFRVPFTPVMALVLDGRYQMGLMERAKDAGYSLKARSITALAGLSLGL